MGEMDEIFKLFLAETAENLDQLDGALLTLEKDPASAKAIEEAFRAMHTVKGSSAIFGFAKLQAVAHAGEDLFSRLLARTLTMDRKIATALLSVVDAMRRMLKALESSGTESDDDQSALLQLLKESTTAAPAETAAPPPAALPPATAGPHPDGGKDVEPPSANLADTTIRVSVGLLDRLMTLVGELVLSRNQILQHTKTLGDAAFASTSQRLDAITADLQESVLKTRMQPIGGVWAKFPRMVRDIAVEMGKSMRVEMEGESTELDRTIIEAIKDPLTHLVRNAAGHGIEPPAQRRAKGKAEEGCLSLRAYHENGQVNVEISDDGAGIDTRRVLEKGLQMGLVAQEKAALVSEREILDLIFQPGFSTADKVTSISGRGVGLDVVSTNIKKIGGDIDVETRPGLGTTFRIRIPLTLAIIPGLFVRCRGQRYAIPQANLVELVCPPAGDSAHHIELIQECPVYRLRGHLLPLIHLSRELGYPETDRVNPEPIIVVLRADGREFGVIVDGILDMQEIVVKPLGALLKGIDVYAGATIMGDGKVALILDAAGLAQRAHVIAKGQAHAHAQGLREAAAAEARPERKAWMMMEPYPGNCAAIALSDVARLEILPRTVLERAAGRHAIQYRGHILPLVDLPALLYPGAPSALCGELIQVVVLRAAPSRPPFGLAVSRLLEGVEASAVIEAGENREGLVGSALLAGRVADILDLTALGRMAGVAVRAHPHKDLP